MAFASIVAPVTLAYANTVDHNALKRLQLEGLAARANILPLSAPAFQWGNLNYYSDRISANASVNFDLAPLANWQGRICGIYITLQPDDDATKRYTVALGLSWRRDGGNVTARTKFAGGLVDVGGLAGDGVDVAHSVTGADTPRIGIRAPSTHGVIVTLEIVAGNGPFALVL